MPGPDPGGVTTTASRPPDPLSAENQPQQQQQPAPQPPIRSQSAAPAAAPSPASGDHPSHKPVQSHPLTQMDGDSERNKSASSGPHSGIPPLAVTSATAAASGPVTQTIQPATNNISCPVPIPNSNLKAVPTSAIARVTGSIIQETKSAPQILIAPNYVHTAHPIKQETSSASPHSHTGTLAASAATASALSPAVATIQHPISVQPAAATAAVTTTAATAISSSGSAAARLLTSSQLAVATAAAVQPLSVISNNNNNSSGQSSAACATVSQVTASAATTAATAGSAAASAAAVAVSSNLNLF